MGEMLEMIQGNWPELVRCTPMAVNVVQTSRASILMVPDEDAR
jgi:hypothetical protein